MHRAFLGCVWLKAFNGIMEILGGIALLFPGTLSDFAGILIRKKLVENPRDFIALNLQHRLPEFLADSGLFAAAYLFSHGIVKILLVAGLLRHKPWAYPSAMLIFSLFVAYQLYRFTSTHSVLLLILTFVDLIVILLTWHEYRRFHEI